MRWTSASMRKVLVLALRIMQSAWVTMADRATREKKKGQGREKKGATERIPKSSSWNHPLISLPNHWCVTTTTREEAVRLI